MVYFGLVCTFVHTNLVCTKVHTSTFLYYSYVGYQKPKIFSDQPPIARAIGSRLAEFGYASFALVVTTQLLLHSKPSAPVQTQAR